MTLIVHIPFYSEPLYYTEYGQGAEAETYETSYPGTIRLHVCSPKVSGRKG